MFSRTTIPDFIAYEIHWEDAVLKKVAKDVTHYFVSHKEYGLQRRNYSETGTTILESGLENLEVVFKLPVRTHFITKSIRVSDGTAGIILRRFHQTMITTGNCLSQLVELQ